MFPAQRSILASRGRLPSVGARRFRPSRGALSMVEVLIGLAIGAMLLTAMTLAIKAGIGSAQNNYDYVKTIQTARTAMLKMRSDLLESYAASLESGSTTALDVQASPTVNPVAYRWVNTATYPNQLRYYTDATVTTATGYRLASNVTSLTFQTQTKTVGSTLVVTNVTITMTLGTGALGSGQTGMTLSESVAPRRVMSAY